MMKHRNVLFLVLKGTSAWSPLHSRLPFRLVAATETTEGKMDPNGKAMSVGAHPADAARGEKTYGSVLWRKFKAVLSTRPPR